MPLTDTALRNAKAQDRPYKIQDGRGLYVLVNAAGIYWRFDFRHADKRQTLALGVYPDVSLKDARSSHVEARKLLAAGINPAEARKLAKVGRRTAAQNSFEVIGRDWFKESSPSWSKRYVEGVNRCLERDVFPYIGKRPITEIKSKELQDVFRRIHARGLEETARRTRVLCGQVFRHAIKNDLAENDPTTALKGEKRVKPKRNFAAFTNPADVARLMEAMHTYRGTLEVRSALLLSALLFQRPGEIRHMEWRHIDLDAAEWRYVTSKTKTPHIVPLSTQAIEVFKTLHRLTGSPLSAKPGAPHYVFPSARSRLRPMSENAVRVALRTLGFTNDEMTPHGFRAMARSLLAESGWKTDAIERQLAHRVAGPLGTAYDRAQYLDERRRMMQSWSDYLVDLREGRETSGRNVRLLKAA